MCYYWRHGQNQQKECEEICEEKLYRLPVYGDALAEGEEPPQHAFEVEKAREGAFCMTDERKFPAGPNPPSEHGAPPSKPPSPPPPNKRG